MCPAGVEYAGRWVLLGARTMSDLITPRRNSPQPTGSHVEIVNAWGWLLSRAPRMARALEATPGASATFGEILAGFDLFHRKMGLVTAEQMRDVERTVTYLEHNDSILIRQEYR